AGTILPGARVWSAPVATTIAMGALDQQRVRLDLTLRTTLGSAWNDRIDLDLLQVSPRVRRIWVDDASPLGNGDGVPQANETYDLHVEMKNYGFAAMQSVTGQLVAIDPAVTVMQGSAVLGSVPLLATASVTFRVRESSVTRANRMLLVL